MQAQRKSPYSEMSRASQRMRQAVSCVVVRTAYRPYIGVNGADHIDSRTPEGRSGSPSGDFMTPEGASLPEALVGSVAIHA